MWRDRQQLQLLGLHVAGDVVEDLADISRDIDNLKRAVESLTGELKEVRKFAEIKDVIGDTNDNLAKIADELRRIREKE